MIISASYKTDLPAFYGQWFMNRLRSGYCKVLNPYNRMASKVRLDNDYVDGFIFWTKNVGPFLPNLSEVQGRGCPFIIQHTINAYPRKLEFSVVNWHRSIEHMKLLAATYGPRTNVWRYDTVVFTSLTPVDFHRANFEKLAKALEGTTDEVVVSFAQIYRKTLHNMNWAAEKFDFTWEDPEDEVKYNLASEFASVAHSYGMRLSMCSQKAFLAPGVEEARCVDAIRLSQISGKSIGAKLKGNRDDCGCYESKDIGDYDTCPHGCVYCYAVRNRELAQKRYKQHDPDGEFLFAPEVPVKEAPDQENLIQLTML